MKLDVHDDEVLPLCRALVDQANAYRVVAGDPGVDLDEAQRATAYAAVLDRIRARLAHEQVAPEPPEVLDLHLDGAPPAGQIPLKGPRTWGRRWWHR